MNNNTEGKKEQVREMFNSIARRYDLLNHTLSMGIDKGWRKKVIHMVKSSGASQVLDVATGTGDLAIGMANKGIPHITGCDLSAEMINIGKRKIEKQELTHVISLEVADAEELPYQDGVFDAVTCAFGVRNFENLEAGIAQMARILRDEGGIFILEFSKPKPGVWNALYNFYFKHILPVVGRIISRNKQAYTYLPQSVELFASGEEFLDMLRRAGLRNATSKTLTGGVATIYSAIK